MICDTLFGLIGWFNVEWFHLTTFFRSFILGHPVRSCLFPPRGQVVCMEIPEQSFDPSPAKSKKSETDECICLASSDEIKAFHCQFVTALIPEMHLKISCLVPCVAPRDLDRFLIWAPAEGTTLGFVGEIPIPSIKRHSGISDRGGREDALCRRQKEFTAQSHRLWRRRELNAYFVVQGNTCRTSRL